MGVKPSYKQTEVGTIPRGWEVATVGSLASFTSGVGISVAALGEKSADNPVPVYGGNGVAGFTRRALLREPSVVVGRVGQKCGEVHLTSGPAWVTDNALYPSKIRRPLDLGFLALALQRAGLNDLKNRNDLPLVTQSILHSVRLPWPADIREQHAVAEVLGDADALLASLDRLIAKKRDLKQAAMQQLLSGQQTWKRVPITNVVVRGPDGVRIGPFGSSLKKEYLTSRGHKVYGQENVFAADMTIGDRYVDAKRFLRLRSCEVRPGDFLISMMGTVGKCLVAPRQLESGIMDSHLLRLRLDDQQVRPEYLRQLFDTGIVQSQVRQLSVGGIMEGLSSSIVKRIRIPLPPIGEQAAIADVLSSMDTELVALEVRREKTRALKQAMMQELLTGRTRLV
jgi:type I restriction enzyme, S subunit